MITQSEPHKTNNRHFYTTEIPSLENEYKYLSGVNQKLIQSKKILCAKTENLNIELDNNKQEILNLTHEIAKLTKDNKQDKKNYDFNNAELSAQEQINFAIHAKKINDLLININNCYNLSLDQKLKKNIHQLDNLQIKMKINYIIIKKLDLNEDFLKQFRVKDDINTFQTLQKLSALGKLNYQCLKNCGPLLMFKIDLETTFNDIAKKSCDIWSINRDSYSIYDEGFNNLDSCNYIYLNTFFQSYNPVDNTLKPGEVVIYFIEKLKNQTNLLESQIKSIDSKSDSIQQDNDKTRSNGEIQLDEVFQSMEKGELLEGIEMYKIQKIDEKKMYKRTVQIADNNLFFIIVSVLFIILSLISFSKKKVIFDTSSMVNNNNKLFYDITHKDYDTLNDYLTIYREYIDELHLTSIQLSSSFAIVNFPYLRFMLTLGYDCLTDYKNVKVLGDFIDNNAITCISKDYNGVYKYTTGGVYTYSYSDPTFVRRSIKTPIGGYYDTSGVFLEFQIYNETQYNNKIEDLAIIYDANNDNIKQNLKAVEYTYTIYDKSLDVFITNLVLVETNNYYKPIVTLHESINFVPEVYGGTNGTIIKIIDFIRLILIICLTITIILRIFQKCRKYEIGFLNLLKIVFTIILQFKNILIILALSFYLTAFFYYISNNDSQEILSTDNFDYYSFSKEQRTKFKFDILSFYLISIYCLKYFQLFNSLNYIFKAFKKSAFEYFSLLIIIVINFLGLSILMTFVYGSYLFEYRNFKTSILENIKIFVLVEDTDATVEFIKHYRVFSVIMLIIFIIFFKYLLLNLFYPIFIEYERLEIEKTIYSRGIRCDDYEEKQSEEEFTWKKSKLLLLYIFLILGFFMFVCPFVKDKKVKNNKQIN